MFEIELWTHVIYRERKEVSSVTPGNYSLEYY